MKVALWKHPCTRLILLEAESAKHLEATKVALLDSAGGDAKPAVSPDIQLAGWRIFTETG